MAVLPQAQWEATYPYHTISYQEYVRQQTAAEGGTVTPVQTAPVTQAPIQQAVQQQTPAQQTNTQGQYSGSAYDPSKMQYTGNSVADLAAYKAWARQYNPALLNGDVDGWWNNGGYQRIAEAHPTTSTTSTTSTSKTKNPAGQTFTTYYNTEKAKNPNLTLDQAHTGFNATMASQDTSQQETYNYNPTPTVQGAGNPSATPAPTTTTTGESMTQTSPAISGTEATNKALQTLMDSPSYQGLPTDQQAMLRMVVQNWDISQELNMDNVLTEFDKIKSETIDPYFAEQVSVFKKNVQNQYQSMQEARNIELQNETATAGENMRNTRQNLESSGMTFTGEGVGKLGTQSAVQGATGEGTVPQANRLMASSTALNYQDRIRNLGVGAEQALGQDVSGYVPGYTTLGITTGSIAQSKTEKLGSTLSSLAGQQYNLNDYKNPVDLTNFNNIYK